MGPIAAEAPKDFRDAGVPCDRECVSELIVMYANRYGVSKKLALSVAECESQLKETARGDSGKAYGVYQFHEPTFREFSDKFGDESLDYRNTEHQVKLGVWALSNGLGDHWTCYRKAGLAIRS